MNWDISLKENGKRQWNTIIIQIDSKSMQSGGYKEGKYLRTLIKLLQIVEDQYLLRSFILVLQTVTISTILLKERLVQLQNESSIVSDVIMTFLAINQYKYVIFWFYTGLTAIFFSLVCWYHFCSWGRTITLRTAAALYIASEFLVMNYLLAAISINITDNQIEYLPLMIVTLPLLILMIYLQDTLHLYGKLTFLSLMVCSFVPETISKFIILLLGFRFFKKRKDRHLKLFYCLINAFIVWSFVHMEHFEIDNQAKLFEFNDENKANGEAVSNQSAVIKEFLLLLMLLVITIAFAYFLPNYMVQKVDYRRILALLKKINQDRDDMTQLSIEEVIELRSIVILIEQSETNNINCTSLFKDNKDVSKNQLLNFLESKLADRQEDRLLLVQVKLEKGEDLFGVLRLLSTMEPKGVKEHVALQKMKHKAEQIFISKIDSHIKIAQIINVNVCLEEFYYHINQLCEESFGFWSYLLKMQIEGAKIDSCMKRIESAKENAQKELLKMRNFKKCCEQKATLDSILKFTDCYEDSHSEEKNTKKIPQKLLDYDFFVIKNQQIVDISKRLITEIEGDISIIIGQHYSTMFPPQILPTVANILKNYKHETSVLPLIAQNKIILKKIQICLLPAFQEGPSFLFIVQKIESAEPMFLFDYGNDLILNFSNIFWKDYRVETNARFDLPNKFSTEIFQIDLSSPYFLELARSGKHINAEFDWYSIIQSKMSMQTKRNIEKQSIKVNLSLIKEFKHGDNTILLLQLKKGHYIRSHILIEETKLFVSTAVNISPAKFHQSYQNEKFFCKIQNPYESTILEKIQNLNKTHRMTNICKIIIIILMILALSVVSLSLLVKCSSNRQKSYSSLLKNGDGLNTEYGNIILLFYYSVVNYHLKTYPQDLVAWNPSLNVTTLQISYSNTVNELIKKVLSEELFNPFQRKKAQVNISFKFAHFSLTADTNSLDIISLFQEIKKSLITFNLTFLLENYQQIRNLEDIYDVASIFSDQASSLMDIPHLIILLYLTLTFLLVVLVYYFLAQVQNASNRIYSMLMKIDSDKVKITMRDIAAFKKKVKILNNINKISIKTSSCIAQYNKSQIEKGQKNYIPQNYCLIITKNWIYILIFLSILAFGVFYLTTLETESAQFKNIFHYLSAIHSSSNFIITQITDAFNSAAWKQVFGSVHYFGASNKFELQTYFNEFSIPSFFQQYQKLERRSLYSDLCKLSYLNNIPYFQNVKCDQVYGNGLAYGYSIAYEYYRNSLNLLRTAQMKNFLKVYRVNAPLPVFIQAAFTRRIIMSIMTQLSSRFVNVATEYSGHLLQQTIQIIGLFSVQLLLLTSLWVVMIKQLYKKSKRALSILKAIPKETLLHIRVSREIMKDNFLQELGRL